MDRALGLIDSYSPGLARLMCRAAGTDGSVEAAEQTLGIYAGVSVGTSQIRRIVQQVGPDLQRWSQSRQEARCAKGPTMYISYDGTGVPMRKKETVGRKGKQADGTSASREVKPGCIFTTTASDEQGRPLRDPDSTSYPASFEPAETFGLFMLQEARLRGLGKAGRSVVIGDGAHWIWNQAQINFPRTMQVLDYYHAREHLSALCEAIWPEQNQSDKRIEKWVELLDEGDVERIANEADQKKARSGKRRETAVREIEYFRTNAERMRAGHAEVSDVGGAVRQDRFVRSLDMRVCPEHSRDSSVEITAQCDFFRGRFSVKIDQNGFGLCHAD